jgi:hypothetical protein
LILNRVHRVLKNLSDHELLKNVVLGKQTKEPTHLVEQLESGGLAGIIWPYERCETGC